MPSAIRPLTTDSATTDDLEAIRALFREYAQSLGVDLGFQEFDRELATLPGAYGPPRGRLFLATVEGAAAGCVGVRPLEDCACELKRLYVRPAARGHGLGAQLAQAAIAFGREAGYRAMRLDTLPSMAPARELYRRIGFQDIGPYNDNPIPGTSFMELVLRHVRSR